MRICGIVSEYNPFHNGHKYMIEKLRENGVTHIVSVMSGNYVQRCEPAILSKNARAEAAVNCGVDLVIEIPTFWATATAEKFASSGVYMLNSLGCVSDLGFGCENDDVQSFEKIADILLSEEYDDLVKENLKKGISFPAARELSIEKLGGKNLSELMCAPNNILAIEYVKACKNMNIGFNFNPIKRISVNHDAVDNTDKFMSALQIRNEIKNQNIGIEDFVPKNSMEIIKREINSGFAPVNYNAIDTAILAKLRTLKKEDFLKIADVSEGLENRIYSALKSSVSLDELIESVKTKRYTQSRIRRIIFDAFFDITKEDQRDMPPYLKVLALNDRGKEILKEAKDKTKLPIIMKSADVNKLNDKAKYVFEKESNMTDVYSLIMPKPQICGREMTEQVFVL